MLGEVVLTAICVLGLALTGWWLMGRLLRPVPRSPLYVLMPIRGDGGSMEQGVRMLIWLRSLGLLNCPILLVDTGLSQGGREAALCLVRRWPDVILWPADDLKTYITYE